MNPKRSGECYDLPLTKRLILDDVVCQLVSNKEGVDDGDGPYPLANNPNYARVDKTATPFDVYARVDTPTLKPVGHNAAPHSSKLFKIELDIKSFSPHILLMGESNSKSNREWLRFSQDEFTTMLSEQVMTRIRAALQSHNKKSLKIDEIKISASANDVHVSEAVVSDVPVPFSESLMREEIYSHMNFICEQIFATMCT